MFGLKNRNRWPPVLLQDMDQLVAAMRAFFLVAHEEDGTLQTTAASSTSASLTMALPVGLIMGWGAATPPTNWLLCDGSAVSRSTYKGLFDTYGTTWGVGDGATTFNLPDGRGRALLGKAAAGTGSTLGSTFGILDHLHAGPSHTHGLTGITVGVPSTTVAVQSGAGTTVATNTHVHALTGATDAGGTGNTGTANGPYFVGNYIILAL